ncbi:hypothetical protein [Methanoplanus endosymbiosus]|uniref:Uncharacterized protein n=1 Tax=Methanoplanus endosymbiosus TaxID=33865 RepID=A0A9E7PMC9_9EURY|nr:hypothetical protein [Methanoplanus endosymbiosus]UUX91982.1 hypothetical protein L6E24_11530 [Methanoplanus endosymbiosus]
MNGLKGLPPDELKNFRSTTALCGSQRQVWCCMPWRSEMPYLSGTAAKHLKSHKITEDYLYSNSAGR